LQKAAAEPPARERDFYCGNGGQSAALMPWGSAWCGAVVAREDNPEAFMKSLLVSGQLT